MKYLKIFYPFTFPAYFQPWKSVTHVFKTLLCLLTMTYNCKIKITCVINLKMKNRELLLENLVLTCSVSTVFINSSLIGYPQTVMKITNHHHHHHHHHVQEGSGLIPVPCILKIKLVPPSLPRSSYVSSTFWFIL